MLEVQSNFKSRIRYSYGYLTQITVPSVFTACNLTNNRLARITEISKNKTLGLGIYFQFSLFQSQLRIMDNEYSFSNCILIYSWLLCSVCTLQSKLIVGLKEVKKSWDTFCNLCKLRYGLNGLITVQLGSYRQYLRYHCTSTKVCRIQTSQLQ